MTVTDQLSFSKNALSEYAKKVGNLIDQGIANEESFYPDFRDLLKNYFKTDEFDVIALPKTESSEDKPDFIVYMDNVPIINIEAKNPYSPIDKWLKADSNNRLFEQVYRYRGRESGEMPVTVTDFLQIWVIDKISSNSKDSDHQIKSNFKIVDNSTGNWKVIKDAKKNFEIALNYACEDIAISINKVSSMIPHLVTYAKKLKEKVIEVFKEPSNPMKTYLESIRNDFLESIFSSDKEKKSQEFADLFAQTLVYGAFVAWMRFCKEGKNPKDFSFNLATQYLPYGTFIHSMFAEISTKYSPDIRESIISKIERIFQSSNFEKITQNTETLMITFYSDFLQLYDPDMAKDRGIVYTPHPIVNFIARGIDHFLKKYFNKQNGIVSSDVFFLDPAAGTMAFPCEILRMAKIYYEKKFEKQPGRITQEFELWVLNQFLKNTYAFEILMAPYVLGHLRTNMLIEELGAKYDQSINRVKLFLFNTLMELQTTLENFRNPAIGAEIVEALNIRNREKILVVMGNPPYSVSSQNRFNWIEDKLDVYYENIQREGRKKLKGLSSLLDDYVKFIRFAQWKISEQNNQGIVALITNNFYLDGITFRGMRCSLYKDFDKIWIVNLQGDSRKTIPEEYKKLGNVRDENVFGNKTSVGVAIVFFIKTFDRSNDKCDIYYTEKWGLKEEKYEFLDKKIEEIEFKNVSLRLDYEFVPDKFEHREKYNKFYYIIDIFKLHINGIKTGHDYEVMGVSKAETEEQIRKMFETHSKPSNKPNLSWNPIKILETSVEEAINDIIEWNWRGFDRRFISYNEKLISRHRFQIMQYLLPHQNNIGLIINRQHRSDSTSSFFITNTICDNKCSEGASGLHSYIFPLKINESTDTDNFKNPKPANSFNIKPKFKENIKYKEEITDEQIFYYIYSVLYSKTYRDKYHFGLKEEFPRIPFSNSKNIFLEMSVLGKRLADLHLFKAEDLETTQYPMSKSTDYKIYNVRKSDKDKHRTKIPDTYDPSTKKIYFKKRTKNQIKSEKEGDSLNDITWIGGITQEMWDFEIGGRQQLKEWLYDRRYLDISKEGYIQRPLNNEELDYFLKMCDAIKKTIELLPEIDSIYRKIDP